MIRKCTGCTFLNDGVHGGIEVHICMHFLPRMHANQVNKELSITIEVVTF